jgi:hypothetical protein
LDKIYKVFVSSTYEDLREERAQVQKALLKLNCLPVGMELFPAADDDTWEFIKTQIVDSDYYVLLIAGRYGSLGADGRSFTEMEFDYALEMKKPTIGFVHGNRGSISRDNSETDPDRAKKLESFIAKVRSRLVRHFTTPQELALEVTTSFVDLKARRPAIGFVRADETVDFKKYSEILEANRDLERRLQELSLSESRELMNWFANDITLDIISESWNEFYERRAKYGSAAEFDKTKFSKIVVSWREIFSLIAQQVAEAEYEDNMFQKVAFSLASSPNEDNDDFRGHRYDLGNDSKITIRMNFFMKGLITVFSDHGSYYDDHSEKMHDWSARAWRFTDLGRAQLSFLGGSTETMRQAQERT